MKDDENIENEVEDLSLNSGLYIEKGPWMILKLPSTFFVLNKTEKKRKKILHYRFRRQLSICRWNFALTHISQASFLWVMANCVDPDQTPQNAVSEQGHHCLLAQCSI